MREVAHLETQQEDEVAVEVARMPERHLEERLANSILVVVAEVSGDQADALRYPLAQRSSVGDRLLPEC